MPKPIRTHDDATRHGATLGGQDSAIRPFRVKVPDKDLADLRRRIAATKWPSQVDKGGHFLAWEQPELFAAELRTAFKSLR